ncbi:MAG: hypothetical protein EZS28_011388 [Streblomastix strix]|uniref:Uncharacterized protein n=1 Tax=Streblomastix strix TaxID=222440 RepID=A0A5J4WF98_9EUKA|nr:MAG: hypothetical protein EZS28_011388 [Streblomastix strix]
MEPRSLKNERDPRFRQIIYIYKSGQIQIHGIGLENNDAKGQDKAGSGRLVRRCDDWADRRIIGFAAHAYAMPCVGVNALPQLRELANAPRELRGVVGRMVAAFVLSFPAISTVLAICDVANFVCDEFVQLRKGSSNRKRISGKRTWLKRHGSLWFQFHTIMMVVSESQSRYLMCDECRIERQYGLWSVKKREKEC